MKRAERSGAVVDVKATTDLGGVEEAAALADVGADVVATVTVAEVAEILKDYLGEDFLKIYAAVKSAELEEFLGAPSAREFEWYL